MVATAAKMLRSSFPGLSLRRPNVSHLLRKAIQTSSQCLQPESTTTTPKVGETATHNTASKRSWCIPEPTWSVREMIEIANQKVTEDEQYSLPPLDVLTKRALIQLKDKESAAEVSKDLAQIWNWIQQIRNIGDGTGQDGAGQDLVTQISSLSSSDIYDTPRGVQAAPGRSGHVSAASTKEWEQVWNCLLKPKTQKVGSHDYFIIPTKRKGS